MSEAKVYLARLAREMRAAGHAGFARELVEALRPTLDCAGNEADAFDVADACYWYGVHYHGGQWSAGYALQCLVGRHYRPPCLAGGVQPDGLSVDLHTSLVEAFERGVLR